MTLPASYTTVADMLLAFPMVGSASTITSASMAYAIGDAQAFINAKLAIRYAVPFTAVPPVIQSITTDLALYNTMMINPTLKAVDKDHPWLKKIQGSVDLLDSIASGDMRLVDSSGIPIAWIGADLPFSTTQDYDPTFYDGSVNFPMFGVDPNKTQDEVDKRNNTIVQ